MLQQSRALKPGRQLRGSVHPSVPVHTDTGSSGAPSAQFKKFSSVCTLRVRWTVNNKSSLRDSELYFLRSAGSLSVSLVSTMEIGYNTLVDKESIKVSV